jgi:hypothetical protein
MTTRKHVNDYSTILNGAIDNSQTTLVVTSDTGLPSIGAGEEYRLTITSGPLFEIVTVTDDASSPTLTVTRGVEGSTAQAWGDGVLVEMRATADSFDRKEDLLSGQSIATTTVATDDKVVVQDTSDSDNVKTVTTQAIADLSLTFKTIAVSGQSDIVADSGTDTLTVAAGSGITLTTNASTDTLTIAASGGGGGGGLVLLSVATISSTTAVQFTSGIDSTYTAYMFVIQDVTTTSASAMQMAVSFDGGSTYKTSQYNECGTHMISSSSTVNGFSGGNDGAFKLTAAQSQNAGTSPMGGVVNIFGPGTAKTFFSWQMIQEGTGGYARNINGTGIFSDGTSPPINAIQFTCDGNTMNGGTISLYGLQKV